MEETYPAKSKEIYISAYRDFEIFLKSEDEFVPKAVPTETQLLNYFHYLRVIKGWKSTSIWSQYSRLNGVLKRRFRKSLKEFPCVTDLLKSYEVGHRVKKATVFTPQQGTICLIRFSCLLLLVLPMVRISSYGNSYVRSGFFLLFLDFHILYIAKTLIHLFLLFFSFLVIRFILFRVLMECLEL